MRIVHIESTLDGLGEFLGSLSERTARPSRNLAVGARDAPLDELAGVGAASLGSIVASKATGRNLE